MRAVAGLHGCIVMDKLLIWEHFNNSLCALNGGIRAGDNNVVIAGLRILGQGRYCFSLILIHLVAVDLNAVLVFQCIEAGPARIGEGVITQCSGDNGRNVACIFIIRDGRPRAGTRSVLPTATTGEGNRSNHCDANAHCKYPFHQKSTSFYL